MFSWSSSQARSDNHKYHSWRTFIKPVCIHANADFCIQLLWLKRTDVLVQSHHVHVMACQGFPDVPFQQTCVLRDAYCILRVITAWTKEDAPVVNTVFIFQGLLYYLIVVGMHLLYCVNSWSGDWRHVFVVHVFVFVLRDISIIIATGHAAQPRDGASQGWECIGIHSLMSLS